MLINIADDPPKRPENKMHQLPKSGYKAIEIKPPKITEILLMFSFEFMIKSKMYSGVRKINILIRPLET